MSIDGKAAGGGARRWALALLIVAIGVVATVVITVGADRGTARAATPAAGDIDSPADAALLYAESHSGAAPAADHDRLNLPARRRSGISLLRRRCVARSTTAARRSE